MADGSTPYGAAPTGLRIDPGTRWRNPTSTTWYQLVSSLRRPCRSCITRHGNVSPRPWGEPLHPGCQCRGLPVPPGAVAPLPGQSPAAIVRLVPATAWPDFLGHDTARLVSAGLVTIADAVGTDDWRILDFAALVAAHGLTTDQLVAAGVREADARAAVAAAGGAAHAGDVAGR